ncbi:TraG family conjugative transposon ATPase [Aquimarina sp. 2201CG14-23]|uniref:TraG family conjugative transposon ATPase n=1 Tax=Aquimarina mycalae TaxID=3040073 RepID=UPI002477E481|nr:TraG family conjugative transposon ATPase [Aquimarina sp. 2201CG14-23]MDH7445850.1 TraG family conjugative transposon ATPase [Aquimarina sp. 2201CG14-23]
MKSESIDKIFPIYTVDNDLLISKKGDISVVYKLQLPQIYSLDENAINQINELFDKVIRSLPEETIVQKQDYFFVNKIKEKIADGDNMLSRSDNQFFYEKPTLKHECYLIITKDSKKKATFNTNQKMFEKYLQDIDEFISRVGRTVSYLTKEGYFSVKRLDSDEILDVIDKYFSLSPEPTGVLKDVFMNKKLQVGDKVGEIYSISSNDQLPINIESTIKHTDFSTPKTNFQIPFIQPISIGLDCNHIYNQVIYIDKSDAIFNKLKTKLKQFKSLSILSKENEITYGQINDLVEEVIEKELNFVTQHYSVIIWNNTLEKLEDNRNQLENSFRELGITPYQVKYSIKDIYINNCPGATALIPENYRFIGVSEQCPTLMNFESYYDSNKSGILFCDRKNESPIRLDLWDDPVKRGLIVNRNRLIFGPSGTGKSFLINHIASQYYEQGHHIVMIDIGNSYKKLCQLVKGQYFTYEIDNPLEFNPFYLNGAEISIDKKVFLISLIIFLWKGDDPYLREEKQIIGLYIDLYYENIEKNPDIFPCMSTFFDFVNNNQVLDDESKYFDKMSFRLSIQDFHDGKYSKILNSRQPIDLVQERFIVFEMDNIKDHPILFPLVTMLCIDVIMNKIRLMPSVKKSIFIDECWKPISKGEMAEFIKYLYKTVRKFYGEVAIATQDVEDILETVAGPAMINNTDTMILLSHKKKMASKDKFAKYLSFSESDLEKLFSTNKREVYIKVGNSSNVYKVKVSPERYACYSSNADENKIIFDDYKKNNNMEVALKQFVEK